MMLPRNTTTEKPTEWNRLQQSIPDECKRGLGLGLGFIFLDNGSHCLNCTLQGKNGPRFKKGEQQPLFWLSHGKKNLALSQTLAHMLKNKFVTRRREGIKFRAGWRGGEGHRRTQRPLAVWAQQHLLMFRKPEYTSEEASAPSSAKASLWAGPANLASRDFSISKCKTREDDSNCLCKPLWGLWRPNYLSLWTTKHFHLESTIYISICVFLHRRVKKEKEKC